MCCRNGIRRNRSWRPGPYGSETVAYDPDSIRPYPFEPRAAALVADYTGPQAEIMPRRVLARQIERAAAAGFDVLAAYEFEFIVLNETADSLREKGFANLSHFAADNRCWSGQTAATHAGFVADLEALLRAADIDLFALGVELGPGCLEATLRHKPAMRAADDAAFFRMFTKAFCRQRGLTASFMPLLGAGFPGIGGHVCLSLRDRQSGKNVFADRAQQHGLSKAAQSFLAGIIDVVPQAFPMCAHTVNAYRRFAPGSWAPKTVSWAPYNYAAAVRTAAETEEATRLELRLPGGDVNVYLALALMLGAGSGWTGAAPAAQGRADRRRRAERDSGQRAAPARRPARGHAPVPRQRDRQAPVRRGFRRAFRDDLRGRGCRPKARGQCC